MPFMLPFLKHAYPLQRLYSRQSYLLSSLNLHQCSRWLNERKTFHSLSHPFVRPTWKLLDPNIARSNGFTSFLFSKSSVRPYASDSSSSGDQPKKEPLSPLKYFLIATGFAFFFLPLLFGQVSPNQSIDPIRPLTRHVSWDFFVNELLAKGEVKEISISPDGKNAIIHVQPGAIVKDRVLLKPDQLMFFMEITSPDEFERNLRAMEERLRIPVQGRIDLKYNNKRSRGLMDNIISILIFNAIFMAAMRLMRGRMPTMNNPFQQFGGLRSKFTTSSEVRTATKGIMFKDVAGMKAAKQEVMEFVEYLKNPWKFQILGAKLPRGALLTGPPGTGKTLLVKALAAEAEVPFISLAGSEFIEIVGGVGAKRVRELFNDAREKAPCIIFIDEIDTIGRKRSGASSQFSNAEREQTLNQLLVEMDGMDTRVGIIIFGATNRADLLDEAILRPGRFDRLIFIDLPTMSERIELFSLYFSKYKLDPSVWGKLQNFASLTPGMSGADIANICNEAALNAAKNGKNIVEVVDFDAAIERVIAGAAKQSRVLSSAERKHVAYHEAGHAVVGWMMKHAEALLKVTIIPRTSAALGFSQIAPKENQLFSADEMFSKMCVLLGGRVAESLIFNEISSGAQDDLKKVTDLAYHQVRQWGMSPIIGHMSFNVSQEDIAYGQKPYSQWMAALIDAEVSRMVRQALEECDRILKENKEALTKVAETLLTKETLTYNEIRTLIGPPPHGDKVVSDYALHYSN